MEKTKKIIKKYLLLIILVLSLPAVRYLFVDGFFGVSDDLHIGWLFEMDRVVRLLQFPPRFVPDLSFGFGYPLFSFVYPLPFYIGEIFHLIGFSLTDSIKLVFGLSIPISMYFMYKLLREYVSEELALAGSILYIYAPYRAVEIFVRGSMGEIVAFAIFPVIILSFIKLTREGPFIKWIGIGGLSIAALVLSHNIMAYMFMPFVLMFIAARIIWISKKKLHALLKSFYAIMLGLLVSFYFWFPAIAESGLMKYDTVFNFYDHFPTLKQFITPFFGYGASVAGPYDTMSFYVGLVGLVVFLSGLVLFVFRFKKFSKEEKVFVGWGIFVFFVSIFMMNHRSAFLWRTLPLLPYFQFPWRFLAMVTLCIPIMILGLSKVKHSGLVSGIILVLAILFNFNYFKTSEYLGRQDDYYINRYIPTTPVSEEYRQTSEEYLRLPHGSQKRPDNIYPRAYTDSTATLQIEEENALKAKITSNSIEEFELSYNKYYYPGWYATLDGERLEIKAGQPYGQITVDVPEGEREIEIGYKESPLRLVFDIVSLAALGFSVYLIAKKKNADKNK